jgi:Tfp pilus assembly protein PilN
MRPVNLIPPEERRGTRASSRTGQLPYLIIGLMAVVLVVVAALTLTNKQISDRESEKATLTAEEAQARATADALAPFAEFARLSEARSATVTSLAQSRFDWVRVLRELSRVLPDDVWLTGLSGSVSADSGGGAGALANGLNVPTLAITGCAAGHEGVAGFLEALKDIDGVTRVGVSSSERGEQSGGEGGSSDGGAGNCRTRSFISGFDVTVAFDSAAVPAATGTAPAPAPTASSTGEAASDPQVADAEQQEQQVRDSTDEQTGKATNAANIVPGVTR